MLIADLIKETRITFFHTFFFLEVVVEVEKKSMKKK